jgi:hypothetical protein
MERNVAEMSRVQIGTVQYRNWKIRIGELGWHSKVTEEEMTRKLQSDLK